VKRPGALGLGVALAVAVALPLIAPVGARAADETAVPEVFEARAEAGGEHDSVAVPAYFETFFPYSLSEASNGSSHSYQAVFYAGFFLTAAAGQFGFPPPPGTAETLFPQGPADATAEAIPVEQGSFGESSAHSGATGASGRATGGGSGVEGGSLGVGSTTSDVKATASGVTATATVVMHDVDLGGAVHIGAISGRATATATGQVGGATADGALSLSGVTVAGAPVEIPTFEVPAVPGVSDVLTAAGVSVRRLPDTREVAPDGTGAKLELGGIQFVFAQPAQDFTATITFGRLRVLARALPPTQAVEPAAATVIPGSPGGIDVLGAEQGGSTLTPTPAPLPTRRTAAVLVRRVTPVGGLDVSALAAVLAVLTLAVPLVRRVVNPNAPRRSP
jgi:hypothetical protein